MIRPVGNVDRHAAIEDQGYGVDGRMGHGIDERVRVGDLLLTAKTYAHFMTDGLTA